MLNGKPPSSRPPPQQDSERLEAARGQLRDGLGALTNLAQLLRSIRTGPKALGAVLPDVHASCAALRESVDVLLDTLSVYVPLSDVAVPSLRTFISPRVQELEFQLGRALKRPVNARSRLTLEQVVTRQAVELDAARELIQLLESAVWEPRVRLDLLELARETSGGGGAGSDADNIAATLACPEPGVEVFVNPRIAMTLLEIGVQLAAGGSGSGATPHVLIERQPSGECSITISRERGVGEPIVLQARHMLPPTVPCARTVARMIDARFEHDPDYTRIALVWPLASAESKV